MKGAALKRVVTLTTLTVVAVLAAPGQAAPVSNVNAHSVSAHTQATVAARPAPVAPPRSPSPLPPATAPSSPPAVVATPAADAVGPGQALTVNFSQPVSEADFVGAGLSFQLASDHRSAAVSPVTYSQGAHLPFTVQPVAVDGTRGPSLASALDTLPPLAAGIDPVDQVALGLELPVTVRFNTNPADRGAVQAALLVDAPDVSPGVAAPGTWGWTDGRTIVFTPVPKWQPKMLYRTTLRMDGLRGSQGNWADPGTRIARFATGADRWVDVDLSTQTLTAYESGQVVNQFLISSGTLRHATVTGHFHIYSRVLDEHMRSPEGFGAPDYYDLYHVPYTQYFFQGFALHGAWWHNNFGHPMSHGCVNVSSPAHNSRWPNAAPQADWLWTFANLGTPVIIHGVTPAA